MEVSQHRREFIRYFFKSAESCNYALLKYIAHSLDEITETADLDLVIDEKETERILEIINVGKNILRVEVHTKSFVNFVSVYFNDCGYLEIDLIHRFDRKGSIYLEAADLLAHKEKNSEGVNIISNQHLFEYVMLFYLLNNAEVPMRYQHYFATFTQEQRAKIFGYLLEKYRVHINTLNDLYDPAKRHKKKILNRIKRYPENQTMKCIPNKIRYWKDMISDLKTNRGYAVSLSGVDGAGKSTVLENLNEILTKKYRQQTVVLRHRPSMLPILSSFVFGKKQAQERAKNNLPRKGKNRSTVSSLFRFSYYYLDYIIGQWYVYVKYILRGFTVLYDRYYFDFIADPRRSNIVLNKKFAKFLYRFVYKPKVNIFLSAPAEIIFQRKQELDVKDIQLLTSEYKQLFDELAQEQKQQHYVSISNIDLKKTMHTVIKECISINNY